MNPDSPGEPVRSPLAFLRRLARPRVAKERCELCDADLPAEHPHMVEPAKRSMICACGPCAILFSGAEGRKYRRVPVRVKLLANFRLTDQQWDGLRLPINLAFFLQSSTVGGVVAFYPSPAGATESQVALDEWQTLAEENPVLRELEADVEALLVNRVGETREHYRVGIDECYKLVGLIRIHWRGLSGGQAVWDEIARFFDGLKKRSAAAGGMDHA